MSGGGLVRKEDGGRIKGRERGLGEGRMGRRKGWGERVMEERQWREKKIEKGVERERERV